MVINFPEWVIVSDCKTATNSFLRRTSHGVVRVVRRERVVTMAKGSAK